MFGADAEHLRLVRWAAGRYEHAGLGVPTVDVYFHPDTSGCYGHLGSELDGRVDICVVIVSEIARDALLHEMGHAWVDEHVSADVRERFMRMRGLTAWNDQRVIWDERGFEHAAETLAWALGHRYIAPGIPNHDPVRLTFAFELLTGGLPLPHPGQRVAARRSGWGRAACPAASRGSRRPGTRTGRRSSGRSAATAGHRCAGSDRTRTCARSCGCVRSAR